MVRDVRTAQRRNMSTLMTRRSVSFVDHHPTGVVVHIALRRNIVMALVETNAVGVAQLHRAAVALTVHQRSTKNREDRLGAVSRPQHNLGGSYACGEVHERGCGA